jgi:phospholipase C
MRRRFPAALAATATVLAVLTQAGPAAAAAPAVATRSDTATPIKHFVFLMQGGRTFDNYFGTYPGADGIAAAACQLQISGHPADGCVKPFPFHTAQAPSLRADQTTVTNQYNNGKMNGFVSAYQAQGRVGASAMGYYDRAELPFYWKVADNYVLFDHFFASTLAGNRSNRSYWVSAAPSPGGVQRIPVGGYGNELTIFDRLQASGISWKFYVQGYNRHATYQSASRSSPNSQTVRVPLLNYARFVDDPALSQHIVPMDQYYRDLAAGTLPAVAYIASSADNERSASSVLPGQQLVRNLVTQLMVSRYWDSSALMWSYDGSGGWYDNVAPPRIGSATLGLRVPALLISAYARKGQVNHTVLSYPSALRFIEQNWHLTPLTSLDATSASLTGAFDFAAGPRRPAILPPLPSSLSAPPKAAPVVRTAMVYGLYGGGAALCLILVLLAICLPAVTTRRRGGTTAAPAATRKDVTVP